MILTGNKRRASSQAGFTLMEMLIAVTLVALMAVGLWSVFRTSIQSWSQGTEFINANQRHRSILDLARKQIASAYPLVTPPPSRNDIQDAISPHMIFSGSENSLLFISLNSLHFHESPGLTLVSYEVAQDSGGEYSLVEREVRYTGQRSEHEALACQSRVILIFENLSSCKFEYFDSRDRDDPSPPWKEAWDGQAMGRLPMAISMTMISRDPQGNSLSRHMVVPIQAQVGAGNLNFTDPFGNRQPAIQ